ncbi:uncharacterized protein LOC143586739 [Bidens hawaiensis]|uniref:uncharacterized protein LOC143586739 n=1 Tax=Bidens hawaiensis TaxID=980011 RepID=UPI0040496CA9
MAVDVYTSPRLSFSNDPEPDPTRPGDLLLSPTFDFDFRASNLTPADELFSNGKILPTQIKYNNIIHNNNNNIHTIQNPDNKTKKRLKELIEDQDPDQEPEPEKPSPKSSFWQFRRSASLNCDNSKNTKGLFGSLSIKSLARSNSTGSALNPKPNSGQKVDKSKESMFLRRCSSLSQPVPKNNNSNSSSHNNSHVYYSFRNSTKESRTGIRIIPVLNVPPAYNIAKGSINFFGFGFCNGKIKKKTRS